MSSFYPDLSGLVGVPGSPVTGLLLHMVALILSAAFSLYGVITIYKYSASISKNTKMLLFVCAVIACIPLFELLGRLELVPGMEFWHQLHLAFSIAAFYYIYRFAMNMDSKAPSGMRTEALILGAVVLYAYAFVAIDNYLKTAMPMALAAIYFIVVAGSLLFMRLLYRIIAKAKNMESAFSLDSFTVSMIPLISVILFALALLGVTTEFAVRFLDTNEYNPVLLVSVALQNVLYMALAMTLVGLGYIGGKIASFYKPIDAAMGSLVKRNSKGRGGTAGMQVGKGGRQEPGKLR